MVSYKLSDLMNHTKIEFTVHYTRQITALTVLILTENKQDSGAPVDMWTWGRVHNKFWQPPKTVFRPGGKVDT